MEIKVSRKSIDHLSQSTPCFSFYIRKISIVLVKKLVLSSDDVELGLEIVNETQKTLMRKQGPHDCSKVIGLLRLLAAVAPSMKFIPPRSFGRYFYICNHGRS